MSARSYTENVYTENRRRVDYCFRLAGQGAAAPTFLEGDTVGASVGSYMTVTRTGVGVYVITTTDPFPGVYSYGFQSGVAATGTQLTMNVTPPTQNANNTWSFTFSVFAAGVAHELAVNDEIGCWLAMRNCDHKDGTS